MKTLKSISRAVKDICFAKQKDIKSLPEWSAHTAACVEADFSKREVKIERLHKVFEIIDKPVRGVTCNAVKEISAKTRRTQFHPHPAERRMRGTL